MLVQDVLAQKSTNAVHTISADSSLQDLVAALCDYGVGAMVITGQNKAITGIITERDVVVQCNKRSDLGKLAVRDVMTRQVVTVSPTHDLHVAMEMMTSAEVRHLPVVDDNSETVLGILTVRDIIRALHEQDKKRLESFLKTFSAQPA